jgi:cytochrome c oxidase assembly protein subunit 15
VLGTVVTGSGPHSGDPEAGRTGFDPELVSQLHADVVFLLLGLTVALLVALAATDAPDRLRRAARDLLLVQLAQGLVGYVQYFTDLPIALVLLHMLGAVLITASTARLVWAVRGPATDEPVTAPAQAAAAR